MGVDEWSLLSAYPPGYPSTGVEMRYPESRYPLGYLKESGLMIEIMRGPTPKRGTIP